MKELSKQICKKCGIVPQYKYIVIDKKFNRLYPINKKELIKTFEVAGNKKRFKTVLVNKLVLDFGQPDNFVKLLELPINFRDKRGDTYNTVILNSLITCDSQYWIDRREFLIYVLLELKHMEKYYEDSFKSMTQSIREAEWKYE